MSEREPSFIGGIDDHTVPVPMILTDEEWDRFIEYVFVGILNQSDDGETNLPVFRGLLWRYMTEGHARIAYLINTFEEYVRDTSDPRREEFFYVDTNFEEAVCALVNEGRIELGVDVNGMPAIRIVDWAGEVAKWTALEPDGYFARAQERLNELRAMPYRDYLQTEHWKFRRWKHLAFADERCQVCNSDKRLHVHHRDYTRRGYERSCDLIVLCAACHKLFHDHGRLRK